MTSGKGGLDTCWNISKSSFLRELCIYGYEPSGKGKRVQPYGSHLVLTLETNKQTKLTVKSVDQ